jgi:Holliday junction resolvasome RuvABC endonuclease subunit
MTAVLGVDLSLVATGVALPDGTTETLRTPLRDLPRMSWIVQQVIGRASGVDVVVLEGAFVGGHVNLAELHMLHGALRLRLFHCNHQVAIVAPATLKKFATGAGNAKKPDMRMALYRRKGLDLTDDNQVDGWWLRAAALDHYGEPVVSIPQAQRECLAKVAWPELVAA